VQAKKRTLGSYRDVAIRKFLIKLDEIYKEMNTLGDACEKVLVFTDESYLHQHHAQSNSYVPEGAANIVKSTSKGRALLSCMRSHPRCLSAKRDENRTPIDDLKWSDA
jgi:hypothetical protein